LTLSRCCTTKWPDELAAAGSSGSKLNTPLKVSLSAKVRSVSVAVTTPSPWTVRMPVSGGSHGVNDGSLNPTV
jgi:hypothetical protein